MIPETLDGWTFEVVQTLCEQVQPEGERHDFKFAFQEPWKTTKTCCAFANAYGGFLVVGVKDSGSPTTRPLGMAKNPEILKELRDKVKAEPEIEIRGPKQILVPGTEKVIYVFEVPRSPWRPHLPSRKEERVFWKRLGSQCEQMTLEEIRQQMLNYEEKREKLVLLTVDISNKQKLLEQDAQYAKGIMANAKIVNAPYTTEILDRATVEAFSLLRPHPELLRDLMDLRTILGELNQAKEAFREHFRNNSHLDMARRYFETQLSHPRSSFNATASRVSAALRDHFGIVDPFGREGT